MFFEGVRTTTWLAALLFLVPGVHDRRFWAAGVAWLTGFEAAFQITCLAAGKPLPPLAWAPFVLIAAGVVATVWAWRRGVRPAAGPMLGVVALWIVWWGTGFHVNGHQAVHMDTTAEVLNEAAKTLWAVAYLWPLRASGLGFRTPRATGR